MRAVVLGLAAAFTLAAAAPAMATPVTYTFSGQTAAVVCTLCDGSDDTPYGRLFNLTINSDTSLVDNSLPNYSRLNNVTGQLTMTFYSATLTGITIVAVGDPSGGVANIQFFNSSFDMGLGFYTDLFNNYDLTQSIGPVNNGNLTPTFNGGYFSTTGTDKFAFTSNQALTFTAAVATGVPEPLTLSVFGIGVVGAAFARRRKQA